MNLGILSLLRCPVSGSPLSLEAREVAGDRVRSGVLRTLDGQFDYPIRDFIPRFVPNSNYADSFGMQWNRFRRTQLDSHSGHSISADRFWTATGWRAEDLAGQWVLDVGCGSGRFAEVALRAGAHVVALDYSSAVDAAFANLGDYSNFHVIQGDVYALPFAPASFAFLYSLGVLQHTPDVARAVASLPPMLAPGGRICVDFYERSAKSRLLPKYWLRPFTTKLPKPALFETVERLVPLMLPVSQALGRIPVIGGQLKRIVPVANYSGELPLDEDQVREWAVLDTFDWLSPAFDNPQTPSTVRGWLDAAHLENVEVLKAGHLVGRARKPAASPA